MKPKGVRALAALALAAAGAVLFVVCRPAAVDAVYPAEKARQSFTRVIMSRIVGMLKGASAMAENVQLKREVASLAILRTDLERLENENARLRSALGYSTREPGRWIVAGVLSAQGGAIGAHKTIRVDKGSSAGIVKGAVVMVPEGLVGRVTEVSYKSAEVMLITDNSLFVACEIENTDGSLVRGVLAGGTEELLALRHLTKAGELPPRSRVVTSGLGGIFPKGLEVGSYLGNGNVLPSVDFSTLEDVFIRSEK